MSDNSTGLDLDISIRDLLNTTDLVKLAEYISLIQEISQTLFISYLNSDFNYSYGK